MKKITLFIISLFFTISIYSQESAKKIVKCRIDTKNTILENKCKQIVLGKQLFLINPFTLSQAEISEGTYKFNYKVDQNGKITFIKGHKGFAKIEIPYEFIGIHFPYYEDDKIINELNSLVSDIEIVHYALNEKQSDCRKLKNVLFYGDFKIVSVYKKS